MKPRVRRALLLSGALLGVAGILGALASPSMRASLSAGYRAFRDPTLLDKPVIEDPTAPVARRMPGEEESRLLDAAIAKDFEKAKENDLDDPEGTTLATLAMPDLKIPVTRRTMRFVRFFAKTDGGRAIFGDRYQRSGRYRPMIEHSLRESGLPEDLVWLAAVESGFDPRAVSPAGAAGLFQFMPETGALYGLDQSQWVDERRSLRRSSTAAVAHLRDLYERFGRWDLALAAYNAGIETVLRGMARVAETRPQGAPQTPIGFAELAQQKLLPEETANYVPQIVAFAIVANNRARFGLDGFHADPSLEMGEIAVPEGTRLRTIARAAGIPTRLLREYNPELLRDRTPPFGGDYIIHLPAERVQQTLAAFPAYLEHERVDDPSADPVTEHASAMRAPSIPGVDEGDEDDGPLPPRPSPIGKNRLPDFALPGQGPPTLSMASLGPMGAKLPYVSIGGGVGWQPNRPDDPLAVFAAEERRAPAAAAKGLGGAALEKQLGFIPAARIEPPPDPFQRFVLPNGVAMRVREDASAPRVAITIRIAPDEGKIAGTSEPAGEAGAGETRHTITVGKRDLDLGLELAAGRLRLLLGETSGAQLASLRRFSALPRRRLLETQAYGPAWLALGDALFPAGHPLEGYVLGAREDAAVARDLLLAESMATERTPTRASVTVIGDVSRTRIEELAKRVFATLPASPDALPIGPHPREERLTVEQNVPATRALYGWIAPGEEDVKEHAAMRVAMWILSSSKGGRLDRALVEKGYASEVRAMLDAGSRASVAVVEVVPAVPHDLAAVEPRLDAEIDAFIQAGPTGVEIAYAVAHLKAGLKKEIASQRGPVVENAPKFANSARIREALAPGAAEALIEELDKMSVQTMRTALRKTLARGHRVVVTTAPK
ncbi:transglycosylase SLT domain-containing protein [Polyangium mundeleinium]|uniref:Transglycosylase SLT domain-containing protein n=1 Tax=Polyangium mundeleinium TaxID=2995306 RepID=A0ABT5EUR3_9BACT|nr:transglycosylase SLT domain-containing protein [Polyangium mundeleinium]MDC0745179.1 transglycosylase SLT domain-containing protein [Polyangium mundeleinium]